MESKVKIELTYAEVYCNHCDTVTYKNGVFDTDKDSKIDCIGVGDFEHECEQCGCKDEWMTMIQYSITK